MNREFEFRGRDIVSGQFVNGDLEYNRKGDVTKIHTYYSDGSYATAFKVDPNSVGEYTGLKDRNGKKIYEGDIVMEVRSKWLGQIDWRKNGGFFYILEPCYSNFGVKPYSVVPLGELEFFHRLEVIGNIHDNPEIIKNYKL